MIGQSRREPGHAALHTAHLIIYNPSVMHIIITMSLLFVSALPVSAQVVILTAENERIQAENYAITKPNNTLTLQFSDKNDRKRTLLCSEIVEILQGKLKPQKTFSPASILCLTNSGDKIFGTILGPTGEEDGVKIDTRAFGEMDIPFEQLKTVRFLANKYYWPKTFPNTTGRNDLLVTKSNDHAEGTINLIQKDHIDYYSKRLRTDKKLSFSNISLLFFMDPPEDPPAPPKTLFSILHTKDGSALQGHLHSLENGKLHFTTLHGNEIKISTSMMAALYFRNGKVIYLSDIPPSEVDENANFIRPIEGHPLASDLVYPWKKDQSAAGSPLVIQGTEFQKGIGVRAYSSLRYDLETPFRRFQASVGIDDALPGGDVQFEIWVNDKLAFQTRARAGETAQTIDLDLSGAKQIRLVVDFGHNANVGDFADWGAARLIK